MRAILICASATLLAAAEPTSPPVAPAPAARHEESPVALDLRTSLGLIPGIEERRSSNSTISEERAGGLGWTVEAMLRHRLDVHVGYAIGLGLLGVGATGDSTGSSSHVDSAYAGVGVQALLGPFWQITPRWHVEALGQAMAGGGKLVIAPDQAGEITGESGRMYAWGLRAGGFYTATYGLLIGGGVGWFDWSGDSKLSGTNVRSDGSGVQLFGTVGYSF